MANFDQFQPDSTQGFEGDYDNDNDFERVDADRPLAMSDNPEEDRYASEQPEAQVPTADLLGSFGFGDGPAAAPAAPDYSSPGADDFGGFVEDPSVPDTTGSGSLGDFDHLQEIKPKEKVEEPKPVSQPPKPAPAATPTATSIAEKPTPSPRSQASPSVVVDLVYWRDLKKSGVVFGSMLFVLIALSLFSFISVLAYLLLAALTVTISFRVYKTVLAAVQKSDEGSPFKPYLEIDVTLSEDQIESYSKKAVQKINVCITSLRHLLLVEDLVDSIKFAVGLWLLTYVGAWFNGLTLIILAYIGLFSMPVVYEKYQAQIDDAVGKAQEQINTALTNIKTKIPWLKKKED
ncbi:reticulon-1-A isoform X2 [Strongylocentrotus purpuratus]|uniref:Reticulon-like protein n=1 Tax=Strongylocentrotus purpuratus TaxID=7668 RepID=A0A7M7PRZ7_STRPU|nr:reticulon-1-A isoform X2 [Strongylocentrotus purpuratus]